MDREPELACLPVDVGDWREWRLTSHGLTWRAALPQDAVAIGMLHDAMEQYTRKSVDRPDPFAPPVMLTLVAEDDIGNIVDAVFVEAVAHIAKATANRQGFAAFQDLLPFIGGFLESRQFRLAAMSVPTLWNKVMEPKMRENGFATTCGTFVHWTRKVRP